MRADMVLLTLEWAVEAAGGALRARPRHLPHPWNLLGDSSRNPD